MLPRDRIRPLLRDTPLEGLGYDELVVLGAFTKRPGASSAWLAARLKGRGWKGRRVLGRRRVARAVGRLLERELIRSEPQQEGNGPAFAATEQGAAAVPAILVAAELSGFEPYMLSGLLADEARGPFRRYRGRVEL